MQDEVGTTPDLPRSDTKTGYDDQSQSCLDHKGGQTDVKVFSVTPCVYTQQKKDYYFIII